MLWRYNVPLNLLPLMSPLRGFTIGEVHDSIIISPRWGLRIACYRGFLPFSPSSYSSISLPFLLFIIPLTFDSPLLPLMSPLRGFTIGQAHCSTNISPRWGLGIACYRGSLPSSPSSYSSISLPFLLSIIPLTFDSP